MLFYVLQQSSQTRWCKAWVGKRRALLVLGDRAGSEPLFNRIAPEDILKLMDGNGVAGSARHEERAG
ncbi:MAG: hypothetical protein JOZ42_07065 [Acetobacteraceae bacterium]|nr:hypothetical protein [Acetobacteraceae bacterium]